MFGKIGDMMDGKKPVAGAHSRSKESSLFCRKRARVLGSRVNGKNLADFKTGLYKSVRENM